MFDVVCWVKITQRNKMSQHGKGCGVEKRGKMSHRVNMSQYGKRGSAKQGIFGHIPGKKGWSFCNSDIRSTAWPGGKKIPGRSVWSQNITGDVVKYKT
jgi:hypothetical protein